MSPELQALLIVLAIMAPMLILLGVIAKYHWSRWREDKS